MGGSYSSNGKTAAYDNLTLHREQLQTKQTNYFAQAQRLKQQAKAQLAMGHSQAAIMLGRQVMTAQKQADVVGGIIANLDSQRAAMEQKTMTDETVKVLSSCVKTLGKNIVNAQTLENTIDRNDDAQQELREIAELLTCPVALGNGTPSDEADILAMLEGPQNHAATNAAVLPVDTTTAPMFMDDDDAFLTWARLQLADNAPSQHPVAVPTTDNATQPPAYTRPQHTAAMHF